MDKPKQRVIVLSKLKTQYEEFLKNLPETEKRGWETHLIPFSRIIFLENRTLNALYQEKRISLKQCINRAMKSLEIQYSQYWYGVALKRLKAQSKRITDATYVEFPPVEQTKDDSTEASQPHKDQPPRVTKKDPQQFCLFRSPHYGTDFSKQ